MATGNNQGSSHVSSFLAYGVNHIEPSYHSDDPLASLHIPARAVPGPPILFGWSDVPVDGAQANLGSTAETFYKWQIVDDQVVDKCIYMAYLAALDPGAGGNNERYIDNIGPMMVQTARQRFNTKIIQEIEGELYFFTSQRELDPYEYAQRAVIERRDISAVDRAADATAIQEVGCYLDFWFTHHIENSWQQYMHSKNSSVRFSVVTRNSTQLLQQNVANTKPTPTAPSSDYITETFLRMRVWALPLATRNAIKARWGNIGHEYYTTHQQYHTQSIGAADTSAEMDLRSITGHVAWSIAVIRPTAQIAGGTYLNSNDRALVTAWTSRKMRANGRDLIPNHSYRFVEQVENGNHFPGTTGHNSCTVLHAPNPSVRTIPDGGLDYFSLSDVRETIYFAAPGATQTLEYWAIVRNKILAIPENGIDGTFKLKSAYWF